MPCNSICSHLINKVNRYLKQSEPYLRTHINFSLSVVELILRMTGIWEKGEKKTSPTQATQFWVCCKQTAGITVMLFDSKSYWSMLLLICIFPTQSQILPHRLCFWKIAFRQLKDASRTLKIILGEYYFKTRIDSARRNEALCGCWMERGDTVVKNDTASWAISFRRSKRNIWLVLAPKNTNQAKETA